MICVIFIFYRLSVYAHRYKSKNPAVKRDNSCREEEIRTLDTVTRILPFQGSSFNHSDTSLSHLKNHSFRLWSAKIHFFFN